MPSVNVNGYELYYEDQDFTEPWRASQVVFPGVNHDIAYQEDEKCAQLALDFVGRWSR